MLKTRVLIVDDSLLARKQLASQLAELGFESVVEAADGEEALRALAEAQRGSSPIGLIITDLRMPRMSGSDFLARVAENPDFKVIPKIIVSVETERRTVLSTVLSGADGYILKPSTRDVLKEKVEKILREKKAA